MKLRKRRKDDDPADEPVAAGDDVAATDGVAETWTAPAAEPEHDEPAAVAESSDLAEPDEVAEPEPAVDSDAIELVGDVAPAPGPPVPPVAVSLPGPPPPVVEPASPPTITLPPPIPDDYAVAAERFDAPRTDAVMNEVRVLAAERPEVIVGAAFAGGIVAAMILRRLGN